MSSCRTASGEEKLEALQERRSGTKVAREQRWQEPFVARNILAADSTDDSIVLGTKFAQSQAQESIQLWQVLCISAWQVRLTCHSYIASRTAFPRTPNNQMSKLPTLRRQHRTRQGRQPRSAYGSVLHPGAAVDVQSDSELASSDAEGIGTR